MISKNFVHKILSEIELEKISEEIRYQEQRTFGELRVSIKLKKGFLDRKRSIRELAIREFYRLGMNNTRDKNGILFFLLLSDREFYILPDEGISSKLPQSFLDELAKKTEQYFREKNFFEGIIFTLKECGNVLAEHFPRKPEDKNELSDKVEIS